MKRPAITVESAGLPDVHSAAAILLPLALAHASPRWCRRRQRRGRCWKSSRV